MSDFIFGFFAPFHGLRLLLSDSRLRALSVLPLMISLVVGTFLTFAGIYQLSAVISTLSVTLATMFALDPGGFLMMVMVLLMWPLGLLFLGLGIYLCIRILAAPLYSYLAEKTLVKLGTRKDHPFVLSEWLMVSLRMLLVSVFKSLVFAAAGVVLFIFSMIPILNVLATIGFMHMIAFDVSDYSFEAVNWPLRRRFQHVRAHWLTYTGFACGLGLVMAVPGLGLILLPAVVVGAAEVLHRTLGRPKEFA